MPTNEEIEYNELLKVYKSYIGPKRILEINKILKELNAINANWEKVD